MSTEDPRCPECGGKIGQTATYCMHCQTDLSGAEDGQLSDSGADDRGWDDDESSGGWTEDLDGGGILGDDESSGDAAGGEAGIGESPGTPAGSGPGAGAGPGTGDAATGTAAPQGAGQASGAQAPGGAGAGAPAPGTQESDGLLDSDGIVDNTLTVIVGIAGGIVIGLVGTLTLIALTGSPYAAAVGFLVWVASTAHLVRRETVQGAISRSAYGVAVVLLLIPLVFLSPLVPAEGGIDDRIGGFVATLVAVAIPAGISAVVGFVAGRFVPENP